MQTVASRMLGMQHRPSQSCISRSPCVLEGIPVLTNTTPRGPQRGPGQNQVAAAMEPILDKAARDLGLDRLAIRKLNAPDNNATVGSQQITSY